MLPEGESNSLEVNREVVSVESFQVDRRRVFKAGMIEFGSNAIPCTIRSISSVDASLDVISPLWFPNSFTLVMAGDGTRKQCHLVWRQERRVRVVFD
jgi:hypothetical protein